MIEKTTSVCTKCGQEKPISEFSLDRQKVENGGLRYTCKECRKALDKAYYDANVDIFNAKIRAYKTKHPGRQGKKRHISKEQSHAIYLLNYAVKTGRIIKPTTCQVCNQQKWLHAHHHHGYAYPLDVIWLCVSCHHAAHNRGPKSRKKVAKEMQIELFTTITNHTLDK